MNDDELSKWFDANKTLLEKAYITGQQPWQQSGFGLRTPRTYNDWEALRKPIADCINRSGTFLDVGCANGYLLECVLRWTAERGVHITPYGLDFSEKTIELAQQRLPEHVQHLWVGNVWNWTPPLLFDYVRTELVYVPDELHKVFVTRLLKQYVKSNGKALIAEYRGHEQEATPAIGVDRHLTELGFTVEHVEIGMLGRVEKTRVAVVRKSID